MRELAKLSLVIAREIQEEIPKRGKPPVEGEPSESDQILPLYLVKNTRGYILKIVNQINGTYERGWYDACAIMIRRLFEILIVEVFQSHGLVKEIRRNGLILGLDDLISELEKRNEWVLEKPTEKILPLIKEEGNLSAHARKNNIHRSHIDANIKDIRYAVEDLLYIAKLRV